jgi:hypothetical protein
VPTTTPGDLRADPIFSTGGGEGLELLGGLAAPVEDIVRPLGVDAAAYEISGEALSSLGMGPRTVCGFGSVQLRGTVNGVDVPYAVRLWDRSPDGVEYLVDRGAFHYLGVGSDLDVTVPLHGNAWRLRPGHRLRLEVTNTDVPYLRPSNVPSSTLLREVVLTLPTCEPGSWETGSDPAGIELPKLPGDVDQPEEMAPTISPGDTLPAGSTGTPADKAREAKTAAASLPVGSVAGWIAVAGLLLVTGALGTRAPALASLRRKATRDRP